MTGTPYLAKLVKAMKRVRSKDDPHHMQDLFQYSIYTLLMDVTGHHCHIIQNVCASLDLKCKLIN